MQDNVRSLQQSLIDLLRKNDVLHSEAVAAAFMAVPRHLFLPGEPLEHAYQDVAIQVRAGPDGRWTSSSSQPSIMAIMLEQLELRPGMRVLEIGAGTGFNAALMAELVGPEGAVTAVDIQPDLVEEARKHLQAAGLERVQVVAGDGGYGWPAGAPYDRIILTASSTTITPSWREQLVEGGRLVLPLDLGGVMVSTAFEKRADGLVSLSLSSCGFMPLQGSAGRPPVFLEVVPGVHLNCPVDLGVDVEALARWLGADAGPLPVGAVPSPVSAVPLPAGLTIQQQELWSGVFPWLTTHDPDQTCTLMASAEAPQSQAEPISNLLQNPLMRFPSAPQAVDDTGLWLLLPVEGGAALLRRAPEDPAGSAEGFDLEVLPLGEGLPAARKLLEALRAWDAAGRPGTPHMYIRAVDAESAAQPQPGEFILERPWTKFMVGYD